MARRVGLEAVLAASVAAALVGCSGGSSGTGASASGATTGGGAVSQGTGSPAAAKALQADGVQLHLQVDGLLTLVQANVATRQVTADDAEPCEVGAGAWPQRRGYSVVVRLRSGEGDVAATTIRRQVQAQGWTVQPHDGTTDVVEFDARKGGMRLRVSGESSPPLLTVEGYGRCIGSDGTPIPG